MSVKKLSSSRPQVISLRDPLRNTSSLKHDLICAMVESRYIGGGHPTF